MRYIVFAAVKLEVMVLRGIHRVVLQVMSLLISPSGEKMEAEYSSERLLNPTRLHGVTD
jgi:hypothetical protein